MVGSTVYEIPRLSCVPLNVFPLSSPFYLTKTRGKKSPGILLRNFIATLINETGHLFSPN